jgi:hypothetical protein
MLSLTPGIGAEPRLPWWSRHVVSDTHQEPDREDDPAGFFRTLAACVALSVPFWVVVALLVREVWR